MFHIGLTEWILLAIIALFLIGPEKLPKMAQIIGQFINELKRAIDSITTGNSTRDSNNTDQTVKQIPKSTTISIKPDTSETSTSHKTTSYTETNK